MILSLLSGTPVRADPAEAAVSADEAATRSPSSLPRPRQLAELGTVLCLYRPQDGGELAGWMRAVRVESDAGMDSDGLYESLLFFDRRDECCWRLFLLPDSDFAAWDRLVSRLPSYHRETATQGMAERLWRRVAGRLAGNAWRLCALRLHALAPGGESPLLVAGPAAVSPLGVATARRVARQEGADGEVRVDDCCCARAAPGSLDLSPANGSEVPLVRL